MAAHIRTHSPAARWGIESALVLIAALGIFAIGIRWVRWYESIIIVPPLPPTSALIERTDPTSCGSIARCWYYATYSTTAPYPEVKRFYHDRSAEAVPFGSFSVDILPSQSDLAQHPEWAGERPARLGNWHNLPDRTLIAFELSKTPSDQGPIQAVLCLPMLALMIGWCVTTFRFSAQHIRSRSGHSA